MYVYMYVCMCLCMYVCVCVCMYVCMYVCTSHLYVAHAHDISSLFNYSSNLMSIELEPPCVCVCVCVRACKPSMFSFTPARMKLLWERAARNSSGYFIKDMSKKWSVLRQPFSYLVKVIFTFCQFNFFVHEDKARKKRNLDLSPAYFYIH